ncbi:MAG: YbjN domain-containing protein [Bryobacteraceae bacterium]|jgi:hypothetical protein
MTTLDKQLARFSQQSERLDANRWELALTNGHALTVAARRDEGFLLLDAGTGVNLTEGRLAPVAERSGELPGAVKFATRRGSRGIRIRAEFPIPEESGPLAERIGSHLEGMRNALRQLQDGVSCEPAGEQVACPEPVSAGQAASGGLADLLTEAGWLYHERPGGALLADLETGGQFLQAEIDRCGAGARFRLTLYHNDAPGDAARQALCLYLLEANAALRYARAFLQREGEGIAAGFEVRVGSEPAAAEAGHALAALSVAGRHCAREMEVLKDSAVAGIYRLARPL